MDWLPSPLWFTGIGVACAAGAVGAVMLIKSASLAFDLGIAAAFMFFLAAVAHGYELKGAAPVQAKFDAFKAQAAKEAADIAAAQQAALAKANSDADARVAQEKERGDALNSKVIALQHRIVSFSAALSNVLQQSGANTAGSDTGPKSGSEATPAAVPDATTPQVYDERELGAYFAATRAAYDSAANAWRACVDEYEAIRAPTIRGASP